LLGLLLELVTNRSRLTRTRHVADRATRRDLLDAATMRGRRYYVKSNMTRQIGEGEVDMLVQEKYVLSQPAAPSPTRGSWRLRKGPRVLRLRTGQIQDRCVAVKNKQDPANVFRDNQTIRPTSLTGSVPSAEREQVSGRNEKGGRLKR
jgi:hypothetical protein